MYASLKGSAGAAFLLWANMNGKLAYTAPEIADLGTVADITRGMGRTSSSDGFTCNVVNASTFNGSTDAGPPGQMG